MGTLKTEFKKYEVHELANIVPMASKKELEALKVDIATNGQKEPILLYKNKIIDGRNRQLVCMELGIAVKTKEITETMSDTDLAAYVKSLNTRRNLTDTQKVMSALKYQEKNKTTNVTTAQMWGVSERTLKNAKYINKYKPEFIEPLFQGRSVEIIDLETENKTTSKKITTIAKSIKRNNEYEKVTVDTSEEVDVSFSVDAKIKTEAGKTWFYKKQELYELSDINMITDYIEFANLKFKLEE